MKVAAAIHLQPYVTVRHKTRQNRLFLVLPSSTVIMMQRRPTLPTNKSASGVRIQQQPGGKSSWSFGADENTHVQQRASTRVTMPSKGVSNVLAFSANAATDAKRTRSQSTQHKKMPQRSNILAPQPVTGNGPSTRVLRAPGGGSSGVASTFAPVVAPVKTQRSSGPRGNKKVVQLTSVTRIM